MKVRNALTIEVAANNAWLATKCVTAFKVVLMNDHPLLEDYATTYKKENQLHIPKDAGVFHYAVTKNGFAHFSYTAGKGEMQTGHGGDWSSNSMTLKEITGIETVEISFCDKHGGRTCGHVVLPELLKYIPDWLEPVVDQIGAVVLVQRAPMPESTATCWAEHHQHAVSGVVKDHIRCKCGSWCWVE